MGAVGPRRAGTCVRAGSAVLGMGGVVSGRITVVREGGARRGMVRRARREEGEG
jgi:hypothetical protein